MKHECEDICDTDNKPDYKDLIENLDKINMTSSKLNFLLFLLIIQNHLFLDYTSTQESSLFYLGAKRRDFL